MKFRYNSEIARSTFLLVILIYSLLLPMINGLPMNFFNIDLSNDLNNQTNESSEDSVLWKIGKGLPGKGATMKPRLVNFTKNGESLIIVGTDEGLAAITLDGFINMSYKTFGPVIDIDTIEDISGDNMNDIILITYYNQHPNLIAIASNNGTEIWKFKPTIEGLSSETYETQNFITYTWDLEIINDIDEDSISEIVIASWYRIFVINGKSGSKIWMRDGDFSNDVWKLAVLEDISNNGYETIIAGSEEGKLCAFDSKSGKQLWTFKVDDTKYRIRSIYGTSAVVIQNSIDDIKIISDTDNDNIDEILISADDGYLRLISGKLGVELGNTMCYNVTTPTEIYEDFDSSPYSSIKRLFTKSGVKIFETPDINNDGSNEYISITCDLDYTYYSSYEKTIYAKIFHINPEFEVERFNITHSLNWTYQEFYSDSYPEIMMSNSGIQIYFYQYGSSDYYNYDSYASAQIVWYDINDKQSENPRTVYNDPDQYSSYSSYSPPSTSNYFLNIGDVNLDGYEDLFAISANGRYLCLDITNNETLWVRSNKDFELKVTEINDLNSNNHNDFLVEQIGVFEPDWIDSSNNDGLDDSMEAAKIINELYTIDGKTGAIIWLFSIPSSQYYDGLRDLKNVGDITDDNIDDYVGWIIPSTIPLDFSQIIEDLTSEEKLNLDLYRTLLFEYTKLIAIDGSDGTIFWETNLLDFPYKFYRQYGYNGPYEDPIELYNEGEDFYNRIDGKLPDNWGGDGSIYWTNNWDTSSLTYPSNIEIINGTEYGKLFDLWGDQGTNYIVLSYNSSQSSELLKIGTTEYASSIGTVERDDELYWVLDSIESGGVQQIKAELSFKPSQSIDSELKYISVNYSGFVFDNKISQFTISIYNFSSGSWKQISTSNINDPDPIDMVVDLNNITDLTGLNSLVKIKIEAKNTSRFSLYIDKLGVDYTYTFKNYSIISEWDNGKWKTIFDLIIPLDFSNDKLLGLMDYPLSQMDRFSAFKLENNLAINTTKVKWCNFTYEIKDVSSNEWILCNWSDTPTWNNYSYRDLQGRFGGYRNNYTSFEFDTEFRNDYIWLITRGTHDADPYVDFDHANPTTLSNFIDSNKNIRIRLNITNEYKFNLTIDSVGIGAFYWGLFDSQYDKNYIMEYDEDSSGIQLTTKNLLNLEIQDFDVVNGTGDKYLDIIAIVGIEGNSWSSTPEEEWSTRIRLFDIKNKVLYTKWSIDKIYIPYKNVRILPINNSLNNWVLSGIFQFGSNYNCSHKMISNPHWESQITHFDNYDESKTVIDYIWEEIPNLPQLSSTNLYEFAGKINISKDGKVGLIVGSYKYLETDYFDGHLLLSNIRIIDPKNRANISKIPVENLNYYNLQDVGEIDFSLEGIGYRLLISYEDFNNDGFLDHVGIYDVREMGEWTSGREIKIWSGNSGDSDPILLYSNLYEDIQLNRYANEISNELLMPFTSIDDTNNDGIPEAIIGIQSRSSHFVDYGDGTGIHSYSGCKASFINFYDIYNSNENEFKELTEYKWILEPIKCVSWYSNPDFEFICSAKRIGDINSDNLSEVLMYRDYFYKSGYEYARIFTTEILDLINQDILYRFNIEVDSIYPIKDLNQDGNNELLVTSGEIIYCISSKFGVQILGLKDGQSMGSHNFDIKWDTESNYDYFEVLVDGISQGPTTAKKVHLSLGSGWKQISIMMYDISGLFIAVETINVLVPSNIVHLILTFTFIGAIVGLYVVYRRFSKKKAEMVLIDKKIKEGGRNK